MISFVELSSRGRHVLPHTLVIAARVLATNLDRRHVLLASLWTDCNPPVAGHNVVCLITVGNTWRGGSEPAYVAKTDFMSSNVALRICLCCRRIPVARAAGNPKTAAKRGNEKRASSSNENKMSDGGRGRASLGVKVWKSSQKWSVQRSAVRSIAWLGHYGENCIKCGPKPAAKATARKRSPQQSIFRPVEFPFHCSRNRSPSYISARF
jgi:hypothetical protein